MKEEKKWFFLKNFLGIFFKSPKTPQNWQIIAKTDKIIVATYVLSSSIMEFFLTWTIFLQTFDMESGFSKQFWDFQELIILVNQFYTNYTESALL